MAKYYVDAEHGDDSRAGTSPGTAWRTLAKASKVAPFDPLNFYAQGDEIALHRGQIHSGTLSFFGQFGTAAVNAAVVGKIGAYGNPMLPKPIIDGTGVPDLGLSATPVGLIYAVTCGPLKVENIVCRNHTVNHLSSGIVINNLLTTTGTPALPDGFGVLNFVVENCDVHNVAADGISTGIGATPANDGVGERRVSNCHAYNCGNDGVSLNGHADCQANDNVIHDIAYGQSRRNGYVDPMTGALNETDGDGITSHGRGTVKVFGNDIRSCRDGLHLTNNNANGTGRSDVYRNRVFDCEMTAFKLDGNPTDGRNLGEWRIHDNEFISDGSPEALEGLVQIGTDVEGGAGYQFNLQLWGNTLKTDCADYALMVWGNASGANVTAKNNLLVSKTGFIRAETLLGGSFATFDVDNNGYAGRHDTEEAFRYQGVDHDFAGWKAAISDDANSIIESVDGKFELRKNDPLVGEDFEVVSKGSPLLNAGANPSAVSTTDLNGVTRDTTPTIGAREFVQTYEAATGGGSGPDVLVGSKGVDSLATTSTHTFDFSSLGVGNKLTFTGSGTSAAVIRVAVRGDTPEAAQGTLNSQQYVVTIGAGPSELVLPFGVDQITVRAYSTVADLSVNLWRTSGFRGGHRVRS